MFSIIPSYYWVILHVGLAVLAIYHILLYKRDSKSALGWIMFSFFVPYAGPIAYYLFGINRVKSRAQNIRHGLLDISYELGVLHNDPATLSAVGLSGIGQRVTSRLVTRSNNVTPYFGGKDAYASMLNSIAQAKQTIVLATYILKSDKTGANFIASLEAAKKRGVDVRVLVDGIGELYSKKKVTRILKQKKIKAIRFLPPTLLPPSIYINLRNHRKLLIIDNQIAYAGGMNISDDHTSAVNGVNAISDVHFSLQGPVVTELTTLFNRDWKYTNGADTQESIENNTQASTNESLGNMSCRVIPDGPDDELDSLALTIQGVIGSAKHTVDIMTPYFLPSRELIAVLQTAALRGVNIRVILPKKNNLFFLQWANRNTLTELLKWGIEIYYQDGPFCHSKLLLIDTDYSLVGSANLDPRSLRLNFELGIEVFSENLNSKLKNYITDVLTKSQPVTFQQLSNRSVGERLRDSATALLSPYL